jgi:DDE superfamily endonuclease
VAQAGRAQAVGERLHQPPGAEARQELGLAPPSPPPSRWSVRTIRASVDALADSRRSGVWRLLQRLHVHRRPLRAHRYSPDPDDAAKVAHRQRCVRAAVRWPQEVVLRCLDEMGSSRWPVVAPDWQTRTPGATAPQVHTAGPTNRQQRVSGALNALTAQVEYRDNDLVGRTPVSAFYRLRDQVYAPAQRIDGVPDTWSIHHHADLATTLRQLPRIEPLWLPTSAPWLTPIEQLVHGLRRDVLTGHRLADDWSHLRQHVNAFLAQFAHGSAALLHTVDLVGDGHLASTLRSA